MRVEMLAVVAGLAMQLQGESLSPAAVVAAFDEQMQLRFLDTSLEFGFARMCGPNMHGALGQARQALRRLPQPDDPR